MNGIIKELLGALLTYIEANPLSFGPFSFAVSGKTVTIGPIKVAIS
jgi:hypothetical protein